MADSISSILQIPFFAPFILRNALAETELAGLAAIVTEQLKAETLSRPILVVNFCASPVVSSESISLMICFILMKQSIS